MQAGDAAVPDLIRPLAAGQGGPDPQDDVKGNATQFQATQDNTTIAFINGDPPADTYNGIDDVIVKPAQK